MRRRIKISTFKTKSCHLHRGSAYFYKVKGFLHSASIPLLGGAAFLLGVMMILPVTRMQPEVYAATEQDYGYDRKISLSIYNNGKEVADNGTVSTDAKAGEVSYLDNTLRINTSKIANYYVGIQAAADGGSNLVGTAHGGTITGVGKDVAPGSFGNNTWGYALTDQAATPSTSLTYSTLPAHADTSPLQYQASNPTDGNHDLKLSFAAKINSDRPSDHYQTKVMVSVAADPKVLFNGIYYMQEMTASICQSAQENDTMQLVDRRDDKSYWVTKLKDGNCWMTQNLGLNLNGTTLKPIDSDVASDWVSTTGPSTIAGYNGTDYHKAQYYDAGEYVNTNPANSENCNAGADGLAGGTCVANGWVNVSGMTASTDPNFGTGVVDNTYNAHYAVGNYYSWTAATAESGNDLTTNNADTTNSICPKGWQLPYAGRDKFVNSGEAVKDPANNIPIKRNKSFVSLFEAYGWSDWTGRDVWGNPYASLGASSYDIVGTPFYLLRGGYLRNGALEGVNAVGVYWASTILSDTQPYLLDFNSSTILPSNYTGVHYYGGFVRCVAR